MAHPLVFPLRTYLYAIGNTSPVNLIQDLAPEQSANILLLGCGDPRNIFFTLDCNSLNKNASSPRTLDITCCDVEPAILARNLLLFTLIIDGECCDDDLWSIFYDLYIDTSAMRVLVEQCHKLVDLASDVKTWHASSYGTVLRVCTQHTLSELRRHWTLYNQFDQLPSARKKAVSRAFSQALSKSEQPYMLSPSRSAGIFQMTTLDTANEHFHRFWSSGVNDHDKTTLAKAKLINPTFVYSLSGEGFAVHYATDAFASFPLAPAFAEHGDSFASGSKPDLSLLRATLFKFVRSTFKVWCSTFREVSSTKILRVRFFAGDALAFCSVLHCHTIISPSFPSAFYGAQWQATILELDGGDYESRSESVAPTVFDVIDTSNMADHVGLLNILVVAVPLLSRTPHSSLCTETLLPASSNPTQGFLELMHADLTTMAVLLDVVPSAFVSRFNSHSNIHELILSTLTTENDVSQFHERMSWKITSLLDPAVPSSLSFDPSELAGFLFKMYLRVFFQEDVGWMMEEKKKMKSSPNNKESILKLKLGSLIHYTRATFALFLKRIKERMVINWDTVMKVLLEHIGNDRTLLLGSNFFQDLCCQLHLFGVYSVGSLHPVNPFLDRVRIPGWGIVPPVIFVSLVVPRQKLKVLENISLEKLGTPLLQFECHGPGFHNAFSSIQTSFGTLSRSSDASQGPTLILAEDSERWASYADLVVSVAIPAWIFSNEGIEFSLNVRSTPANVSLMSVLGMGMNIFRTPASDKAHVFLSRSRPNAQNRFQEVSILPTRLPTSSGTNDVVIKLDPSHQFIVEMSTKAIITDPVEQGVLEAPSRVPVVPQQVSAGRIKLTFGSVEHMVQFPYSIDGTRTKLKIARKSHYVEVIAFPVGNGCPFFNTREVNKFPLLLHGPSIALWNIHRVHLDHLPIIKPDRTRSQWLQTHLQCMASDYERTVISGAEDSRRSKPLPDVKNSLQHMFAHFVGTQDGLPSSLFGLKDDVGGEGVYAVFLFSSMRLDLASHSLVLDGYVLPIAKTTPEHVFQKLTSLGGMRQINAVGPEMLAWKQLIPAFVERCRQTWTHRADCEYIKTGRVPLSFATGENPICQCGQGKEVEGLMQMPNKSWKNLAPFCTRIAISPLYAVSYVESVVGNLSTFLAARSGSGSSGPREEEESCQKCGSQGKLMGCGRCKKVKYCSQTCQRNDWKAHKMQCVRL
ncbi:hypothetical protein D9757_002476 [Collybiopsis confluens]|uniref:MYND-type domain-containing protein n=1 Tax=Collybiopsis confluens TaxID=2823264 RepID=A0A8H5MF73_9AGAR|nr:hypothetical protein D9757_002476 [Collybiopsis confluens]